GLRGGHARREGDHQAAADQSGRHLPARDEVEAGCRHLLGLVRGRVPDAEAGRAARQGRAPSRRGRAHPAKVADFPVHDPDGFYYGFAISGYGLMWNTRYLQAHKLPAPKEWVDLVTPAYFGHLVMSAPSRSGTTHLTVEVILQAYGWDKGWALLLNAGG